MLNYELDPSVLAKRVPAGTDLDLWNGKCLVSMVGFRFLDTRVLRLPIPFHKSFEEVNLRFYVRREATDGARRGVVFVREIVPRRAIAWVARTIYNESYVALPMRHRDELDRESRASVHYEWRHAGRWNRLGVTVEGQPQLVDVASEEAFITEHYWGYCRRRDGSTLEYRVDHPRWRVWQAAEAVLDCDVEALYGAEFCESLGCAPRSAFVADGSAVVVRRGVRLV